MRRYLLRDLIYILKSKYANNQKTSRHRQRRVISIKFKVIIILTIMLSLMIVIVSIFESKVKPMVDTMAESRAKVIAFRSINEGIREQIVKKIEYEDLIILKKDSQDRITALQTNIVKMNQMQALTSQIIQDRISSIESSDLQVPLGSLFNSSILAGLGPKITIKIIPFGSVESKFIDEFISAGINQTKHKISLQFKATIIVIIPLSEIVTEVMDTIPIAETIIVGNVPDTYLDNGDASSSERERAEGILGNFTTK